MEQFKQFIVKIMLPYTDYNLNGENYSVGDYGDVKTLWRQYTNGQIENLGQFQENQIIDFFNARLSLVGRKPTKRFMD